MTIARVRSAVFGRERKAQLGSYRVEQRQIMYRGQAYHFVSYEGQRANPARSQLASAAAWFLMSAGTRWEVMPQVLGQEPADIDQHLLAWLKVTLK